MMTVPFRMKEFAQDSFMLMIGGFLGLFHLIISLPLIFYLAFALAREKEIGMTERLIEGGLSRVTHFFSWLLFYTILALLFSVLYTLAFKKWVY